MDVELPDGTIIEDVPEGTTKSQLMAKLKASGYDVSKLMPGPSDKGGKFRFASPETEQAGIGAIGRFAQAAEDYFTKPVAPAPANVQAQGYDPLAGYAEKTIGNVPQDVTNIAQGFTPESLGAVGSALYNQPLNTLAGMGSAAVQGAGQFLADPAGTFANAPISTMMGLQGAQLLRAPGRVAANVLAEKAYPLARRAISPTNRMLSDVFGAPEIQAALQEAPPGMTVPQALADVNAPRAQAVAKQAMSVVPDQTRATQLAQEEARRAQLSQISRTPEELKAAEEARGATATQNYRQAFKQAAPEIPEEFLDRPSMKAAFKEADNIAAERGGEAAPVEQMHNIKLALDKIVSKPEDYGLGGAQKSAIASTRQEFIDQLLSVPEYAKARADFAAQSVPINKMKVGQALLDAAMEPVTEGATRAGTFARAVEEAPKTIKKATGQEFFTKLEEVLSPDEMDIVNNVRDEFRRTKLADEQAKLGAKAAPEVEELASAKVTSAMNIPFLNRAWTIANTVVKRSLGKIDEKLATDIGIMMQDPAELNRAIAKAKRYEKNTAKTVKQLRERRQRITGQAVKQAPYGAVTFQNTMAPQQNQNAMAR
jgi:hypothetical protein